MQEGCRRPRLEGHRLAGKPDDAGRDPFDGAPLLRTGNRPCRDSDLAQLVGRRHTKLATEQLKHTLVDHTWPGRQRHAGGEVGDNIPAMRGVNAV